MEGLRAGTQEPEHVQRLRFTFLDGLEDHRSQEFCSVSYLVTHIEMGGLEGAENMALVQKVPKRYNRNFISKPLLHVTD